MAGKSFELFTTFNTQVCVDLITGIVRQRALHSDREVYIWIDDVRQDVSLLYCLHRDAMRISGERYISQIYSYRLQRKDLGWSLYNPLTRRFLSSQPGGSISSDRAEASLWETFEIRDSANSPPLSSAIDICDKEGLLQGHNTLEKLSQLQNGPHVQELSNAIIRLLPAEAVRMQLPAVVWHPSYERLFPAIREVLAEGALDGGRQFVEAPGWGNIGSIFAGSHTYGSPRVLPYPPAVAHIGKYCSIAEGVTLILGNHLTKAASPFPFQSESAKWPSRQIGAPIADDKPGNITIGNDIWIGRGATILAGTVINDGAVIGADAVVRGVVPPYTVYGGNPGRVLRERFPPQIVNRLMMVRWWDWPDWKVDRYSALLMAENVERFLDAAEADPI